MADAAEKIDNKLAISKCILLALFMTMDLRKILQKVSEKQSSCLLPDFHYMQECLCGFTGCLVSSISSFRVHFSVAKFHGIFQTRALYELSLMAFEADSTKGEKLSHDFGSCGTRKKHPVLTDSSILEQHALQI